MTDGPGINPELEPNSGLNPEIGVTYEWKNGTLVAIGKWDPSSRTDA